MKQVWKYELEANFNIKAIPKGAEILSVTSHPYHHR